MDAVTYPNPKVIEYVEKSIIPLQLKSDIQPLSTDYNVKWTPNLLIIDQEGKEHHRVIGFLPPVEFIASVMLGIGKTHFDLNQFEEAIGAFERVISEYAYSSSVPETLFFRGVALYKSTHQPEHLKEAYHRLQNQHPQSEWAKRAYPYWHLP